MHARSLFFSSLALLFIGAGCGAAPTPVATFPVVTPNITSSTQPTLPPIADPSANAAMLPAAATSSTISLAVDQAVFANWKNGAVWYEGKITAISGKLYTIKYNAGDTETDITENRILAKPPAPPQDTYAAKEVVIAKETNGSWYKGLVNKDHGTTIDINFDDKSFGTVTRENIVPAVPHKTGAAAAANITTPAAAIKTARIFLDHTKVLVNWKDGPRWWNAVLNQQIGDQYSVTYDDDHSTENVPATAIANLPTTAARTTTIGDKIIARAANGYWYNATVSSVNGLSIGITFFDGFATTISPTEFTRAGS